MGGMDSNDEWRMTDIMTARDVAELLRLNERTVLRLAQSGRIPAAKIARRWRFRRNLVNDWLEGQMHQMPARELDQLSGPCPVSIVDSLRPELISLNMSSRVRAEALRELVDLLVQAQELGSSTQLLPSLVQREEMMSTALAGGVAIPHPRRPLPGLFGRTLCVVGRSPQGVDFGAPDGDPTHVFFLICAPDDEQHLKFLAGLTRLLRSAGCVRALLAAPDAEAVVSVVATTQGSIYKKERARAG